MKFLLTFLAVLVSLSTVAMGEKFTLAVTDIEGMEGLQREFGKFKEELSSASGYEFEFIPVPNRTAAVEAMKAKKVDFVLTGPAEYVIFKKLTDSKIVVGFSRPDYFCDVIVLADSGITSVSQLKGKKIAVGSVGSTSKHLAPFQVLKDNGIDPSKDIEAIHTSIDIGWDSLKKGDVEAFATTNDKYVKMRGNETELAPGAFRVIARSADLPNDILLSGPHVKAEAVEKVREVFISRSDELVAAILVGEDNKKYAGMKFVTNIEDKDYNLIRAMYATCGYPQFSDFIGD